MATTQKNRTKSPARTDDEVRTIVLRYFYDRSKNATSVRGKRGFAAKITDVRRDLKASHGLTLQQVLGNLNYLMSQGWVAEEQISKSVPLPSGTVVPQSTSYYKITAAGTDKIDGPSEFTMKRFHDIKIEATGQNIITLGAGNVVNAQFHDLGKALVDLREAIAKSEVKESQKMELVADIETIQSQLAKPKPRSGIIAAAWEGVRTAATINGVAGLVERVAALIGPLIG